MVASEAGAASGWEVTAQAMAEPGNEGGAAVATASAAATVMASAVTAVVKVRVTVEEARALAVGMWRDHAEQQL